MKPTRTVRGDTARHKQLAIRGVSLDDARARLGGPAVS